MMSRCTDVLARRVAYFLTRHGNIGLQHLCAKCKPQELRSWLQTEGFPTEAGNIGEHQDTPSNSSTGEERKEKKGKKRRRNEG